MNGRQRVLAAIQHQEPDRVPVDIGSTPSSGISATAHYNLMQYLGQGDTPTRVYDVVQQVAQPDDAFLDRFGIDAVDIGRAFDARDEDWYDITLPTGLPVQFPTWFHAVPQEDGAWDAFAPDGTRIATMPLGASFFDQTCFPYVDGYPDNFDNLSQVMPLVHWSGLAHSPWDHAGEADFWEQLRARALDLRQNSDRALMIVVGCNLFEWGTFLRRIDNFLCDLMLDPEGVERLLDALMERHLASLGKVCEWLGDVCDVVKFGDDLGMDSGPLMQPDIYRELFKPRHAMLNDYAHRHSGMKTLLHSCGSIHSLLPDLIEAGFDAVNPVQINARDMEPWRLKKEFGKDIAFWGGGVNTRVVLNGDSPQKVRDQVKENLDIFAPGGGFVFAAVHNILPDVPPENIEAMYQALDEYA